MVTCRNYYLNYTAFTLYPMLKVMIIKKVLEFWFTAALKLNLSHPPAPIAPSCFALWFGAGPETDKLITETFETDLNSLASNPQLQTEMKATVEGAMALVILFDQLTRNIFRNKPEAFKYDSIALETAKLIREKRWDLEMNPIYRGFAYLPFEHSEVMADQQTSVHLHQQLREDVSKSPELETLYGQFCAKFLDYAVMHRDIIQKFGRYPHRNFVLGRTSTPEEIEYLESGAETFGVTKVK